MLRSFQLRSPLQDSVGSGRAGRAIERRYNVILSAGTTARPIRQSGDTTVQLPAFAALASRPS